VNKAASPFVIAIDLGGSKILSAVVNRRGEIVARDLRPTQAARGVRAVIEAVAASACAAEEQSGLSRDQIGGIGLGAAGISNPVTGVVYLSPNLPDWRNVPVRDMVAEATWIQVFLINDANAAALGEMRYGAAKGCRNFVFVTISTGIGGGIITDGKLYTGASGMAGEIGHITVEPDGPPCNCGGAGCWELYASGSALARRAREEIERGEKTCLMEMAGGDPRKIDAPLVKKAVERGDTLAQKLVAEAARYLGIGLGSLINVFNPELIVIGGGFSGMGDMLLKPAFAEARRRSYRDAYDAVRFALAGLGGDAGVIGAAIYAFGELKKAEKTRR